MKEYYFINSKNERIGPISKEELLQLVKDPETVIWTDELTEWIKLKDYSELSKELTLKKQPPPLPSFQRTKNSMSFDPSAKSVKHLVLWVGANLLFALLSFSGADLFNRDNEHSQEKFWPFVSYIGEEIDWESYNRSSNIQTPKDSPVGGIRYAQLKKYFKGLFTDYDWTEFFTYSGIGLIIFIIGNLKEEKKE